MLVSLLYGGHTYQILEDDTIVYEYKTDLMRVKN
jgi:hypothetical protein